MHKELKISHIKFGHILVAIFLLHIAISFKSVSTNFANFSKTDEEVIKLKLINPVKTDKPHQIVATEESKIKTDAKAQFLSAKNNTVDRQTRAKTVASFKKAGLGNSKIDVKEKKQASAKKEKAVNKTKALSFKDLAVGMDMAKSAQQMAQVKGIKNGDKSSKGQAQNNDFVKDIPLGDFTKLNTQEYEFYGFYFRIRQKLEQFWGLNIQEQAEKFFRSGRHIASDSNLLTSLTITLDKDGKIVGVNVNSTSGIRELDQAAVKSFNQAGPFPNPPRKMLKNGKAKIEWSFVVNT